MTKKRYGFLAAGNLNIDCLGEVRHMGECSQYNYLLNKFPNDQVFLEKDGRICFLNGYLYSKTADWPETFSGALSEDAEETLKGLRGGFCGYLYEQRTKELLVYTDQIAVKPVYYYVSGDRWMVSDRVDEMVEVLRHNGLTCDFQPLAAQYMLTYGYMIDDTTFIRQIHRLLPGTYMRARDGRVSVARYHFIQDVPQTMSEEEAVEKIDAAFREAVRREFEKDREYGYRHLVDLSGGLDSRMVSWVAHDLGYTDQVNITYCRDGYRDEKIARQISLHLGHEYLFKPLDDGKWMYDIDEMTSQNNGAALYMGMTGGRRLLEMINMESFGIEHTGMIGDAILGTLYRDKELSCGKPVLGQSAHSERLHYQFDEKILQEYPNQEMFGIYTRGMLGASSSYMIRQQYIETASPFMDVDLLDAAFSIPFDYRKQHHIYLRWLNEKYPQAAEFGWEKWGGVKPKESHITLRKMKTVQRLIWKKFCVATHITNRDSMNPVDYWYNKDVGIQKRFAGYMEDAILNPVLGEDLRKDIRLLFTEGSVEEKSLAITVLAMVKKYFG
ncbi:MAG: asparagine synthase [Lachnospiraceae bacterium]|nr:asparagine synthase [Lachnospiraceae bacterium]